MILDEDPHLRERVVAFIELHLGNRNLLKVGEDPK
jgi:hypothetical protein